MIEAQKEGNCLLGVYLLTEECFLELSLSNETQCKSVTFRFTAKSSKTTKQTYSCLVRTSEAPLELNHQLKDFRLSEKRQADFNMEL